MTAEHPYDDMIEAELEVHLNELARLVDAATPPATGFVILLNPFDHPNAITQYVCNGNRQDAVRWLRLVADRMDAGDAVERVSFPKDDIGGRRK